MCFDEQITQGKVHFTMPNIIFRTRTMSCELAPLLCRPLLNVSLTRHTKEKCRIDQQYIFHWWSVKIFNCLSFRRQFKKKLTSLLTPSFIICLVHSRYTSYYTIEVDPNQNKRCKQSPHICAEWTVI
jgi:hypothetical protein